MKSKPAPCPFCGVELKPLGGDFVSQYQHPYGERGRDGCFLLLICKETIPVRMVEEWNMRAAEPTGISYVVQDGYPRFNREGRGSPVSLEFLNACFDYLREN